MRKEDNEEENGEKKNRKIMTEIIMATYAIASQLAEQQNCNGNRSENRRK